MCLSGLLSYLTSLGGACLENMDGLPDITISMIMSYLDLKEAFRCAGTSKIWLSGAREKVSEIKKRSSGLRAQVGENIMTE